jgi:hypothetical protein
MRLLLAAVLMISLGACALQRPAPGNQAQIAALAQALRDMSPNIDANEATRAAEISYHGTYTLARAYGVTDRALIHNAKVNAGLRPRGLCYHWAEDIQALLEAEGFKTLAVARAIANSKEPLLIEHSTAVLIPVGAAMKEGVVIDPWRKAGTLFWSPVATDDRYDWLPREQVLRDKGQIRYVQHSAGSLAPPPAD